MVVDGCLKAKVTCKGKFLTYVHLLLPEDGISYRHPVTIEGYSDKIIKRTNVKLDVDFSDTDNLFFVEQYNKIDAPYVDEPWNKYLEGGIVNVFDGKNWI